jgi:type I restriction enzyme S subunit
MSEWKEYKLGEIVTFQRGHDLPKDKMIDGDIPVAGSNGIIGYHNQFTKEGPGVTIGRSGNIGIPHYYPNAYWAHNTVLYIIDFKGNDTKFMYYLLKTFDFTQLNTGSAVPSLNRNHIHELPVSIPDLPTQHRIASILSSLDDKIDLLHRENKTLEAMAETLFRQWFIEEAKEDWEEGKLGDFVSVIDNRGKTPPYTDNITEYPIIEVNALTGEDRYVKYNLVKKYVEKDIYDFWFRGYFHKYDIFVSTVGSIGELAMCLEEKGVIAQNVIALHANNISPFYLYQYLNYNKDDLKGLDIGSVQPSIKVPHLLNMSIIIPPHDKLKEYDIIMLDIIEKEEKNIKQIQTLIQQRDSLLPKLMSGEVKI